MWLKPIGYRRATAWLEPGRSRTPRYSVCLERDRIGARLFDRNGCPHSEVDGMVPSIDIFRIVSGDLRWCEAVENVETAKARIEKLALSSRGSYFIYDQKSGQRIHVSVESGNRNFERQRDEEFRAHVCAKYPKRPAE